MKPADRIRLTEYTYRGKIYDQKQVTELLEQLFADSTEVISRLDCEFFRWRNRGDRKSCA